MPCSRTRSVTNSPRSFGGAQGIQGVLGGIIEILLRRSFAKLLRAHGHDILAQEQRLSGNVL